MKVFNEYQDKLANLYLSQSAKEKGFDVKQPECFIQSIDDGSIFDDYTGMIPDGHQFYCYRPTLTLLQSWLREGFDLNVEVNIINGEYFSRITSLKSSKMIIASQKQIDYYEALEKAIESALLIIKVNKTL